MTLFSFTVDEIELAGGSIVGSVKGTFEADPFDYEPSNVVINSRELWLNDSEPVELTADQLVELLDVVSAALSGCEKTDASVVVSAVGVEV